MLLLEGLKLQLMFRGGRFVFCTSTRHRRCARYS